MKKLVLLIVTLVGVFGGCVATNDNGTKGVKGVFTGHVYTADDYETIKDGYVVVRNSVGKVIKVLKKVDGKLVEVDERIEDLRAKEKE